MRHPVADVAAPAAKVFRIGADPGAELRSTEIRTGARPSCDTRPGLRSRPLSRRSGCSSAEPYPPFRPLLIGAVVLAYNFLHHATGHSSTVSRLLQHARCIRAHPTCREAHQPRSVPSLLYRGNGNAPSGQSAQALPACGRTTQPAGSLQRLEHLAQSIVLPPGSHAAGRACSDIIEAPSKWLITGGVVLPPGRFADCAGLRTGRSESDAKCHAFRNVPSRSRTSSCSDCPCPLEEQP